MKYILRIFKFFLLISVAWGLLFGLWLGLYAGIENGINYGLRGGFIFGAIVTAISALYDYIFRMCVFKKYGKRSFEVIQERDLILEGDVKDLMQESVSALKTIGAKKILPNYSTNKINAVRGTTWKTYGEKIGINLISNGDKTKIYISSRPRLKTAIFDGGRNIENVEMLCSHLKRSRIERSY